MVSVPSRGTGFLIRKKGSIVMFKVRVVSVPSRGTGFLIPYSVSTDFTDL